MPKRTSAFLPKKEADIWDAYCRSEGVDPDPKNGVFKAARAALFRQAVHEFLKDCPHEDPEFDWPLPFDFKGAWPPGTRQIVAGIDEDTRAKLADIAREACTYQSVVRRAALHHTWMKRHLWPPRGS